MDKDMVGVNKHFPTVHIIKDYGNLTYLMGKEFLQRKMVEDIKVNSKMIKVTVMANINLEMVT